MTKLCYSISRQLQDDLLKAYVKVCKENRAWSQLDAYKMTVKQPAPRYYVSSKQAYQIISRMMRGDFSQVDTMLDNRRRMYHSLFEKVIELSESTMFVGKSLWHIIPFAITSPAPEFFVKPERFAVIRAKIKRKMIDDDGRWVKTPCDVRRYEKLKARRLKMKQFKKKK